MGTSLILIISVCLYYDLKCVWKCTVNCMKLCNHGGLDQVNTASMICNHGGLDQVNTASMICSQP